MERQGFTLAELLIALAILGVIATFSIPKVLQSQQDTRNKAIAKEAAAAVAQAYAAYQQTQAVNLTTFRSADLLPYLNYVKMYTGTVDDDTGTSQTCGTTGTWYSHCPVLHNGAVLILNDEWGPNAETPNGVWFAVDTDAKYSNGNPGSMWFIQYANGRLTSLGVHTSDLSADPSWFRWD